MCVYKLFYLYIRGVFYVDGTSHTNYTYPYISIDINVYIAPLVWLLAYFRSPYDNDAKAILVLQKKIKKPEFKANLYTYFNLVDFCLLACNVYTLHSTE